MDRNTSGGHRPDTEDRPVTDEADLPTEKATTSSGKGFSTFVSVLIALGFLLLVLVGVVLLVIQAEFG